MNIEPVETPLDRKAFLELSDRINVNDPNWIRPLDKDVEMVFDPKKNKKFKNGEAKRWILKSGQETIGRVAAFIDHSKAWNQDIPTGGMGFFECVNDRKAAQLLLGTCQEWLEEHQVQGMDGPINFGEKDRFWGLLVDGFYEPTYCMNYNPSYYMELLEDYGFQTYYNQYTYYRTVRQTIPDKFREKSEGIFNNSDYEFAYIRKNNLSKVAQEFCTIYNQAWGTQPNFKPLAFEQAMKIIRALKPVLVEDLVWFGYYKNEPVAFFIMLPELNRIFKRFKGKFKLWQKLQFKVHQWLGTCRKMFGLVFGIVPEHQGLGVEGALIMSAGDHLQQQGRWDDMEMTWIGDFNPKMLHVVESLGAEPIKQHKTYRKLFNENIEFKRAQIVE